MYFTPVYDGMYRIHLFECNRYQEESKLRQPSSDQTPLPNIAVKLDDPRPYNLNGCRDRGSFWFVASYVLYVHVISQLCSLRAICEMLHVRLLYVNKTGSSRTRRYAGSSAGMDQRA